MCEKAIENWDIAGIERIINGIPIDIKYKKKKEKIERKAITKNFAMEVHELLPVQPWKPGIHKEIVEKLNCTNAEYFDAVKILINEGLRFKQKDGVVYDDDGNIITFDKDRVDSNTLELK